MALDCTQPTGRVASPPLSTVNPRCRKSAPAQNGADARQPPGTRDRPAIGGEELCACGRCPPVRAQRAHQSGHRPGLELGVLVEQQAELAPGLLDQAAVVGGLALTPLEGDQPDLAIQCLHGSRRSHRRRRCPEPGSRARYRGNGSPDRLQAGEQKLAPVGVDHAVGEQHRRECSPMRVQLVDPAAYTPPYDHALAGALAREGAEVELVTSRFSYGPVPLRTAIGSTSTSTAARLAKGSARVAGGSCGRPSTSPTCSGIGRRRRRGRPRPLHVASDPGPRRPASPEAPAGVHDALAASRSRDPEGSLRTLDPGCWRRWTRSSCTRSTAPCACRPTSASPR